MKKALSLISWAGLTVVLFVILPYLPPTFFSAVLVVVCMAVLAIWGRFLYKKIASNKPVLTELELEDLDRVLESLEEGGEAASDYGESVEIVNPALLRVVHKRRIEQKKKRKKGKER